MHTNAFFIFVYIFFPFLSSSTLHAFPDLSSNPDLCRIICTFFISLTHIFPQSPGAESVFAEDMITDDFFTAAVPTSFLGTPLGPEPPTPLSSIQEYNAKEKDDMPFVRPSAVKVDVEYDVEPEDIVDKPGAADKDVSATDVADKRFLLRSAYTCAPYCLRFCCFNNKILMLNHI